VLSVAPSVAIKGQIRKFMQPGWYCTHCDNVVLSASDNDVFDREAMELRAGVEGVLSGVALVDLERKQIRILRQPAAMPQSDRHSLAKSTILAQGIPA
jgi:hypothetical protein